MPNELRLLRFQVLQLPPVTLSFVVDNYIIFVYPKHARTILKYIEYGIERPEECPKGSEPKP